MATLTGKTNVERLPSPLHVSTPGEKSTNKNGSRVRKKEEVVQLYQYLRNQHCINNVDYTVGGFNVRDDHLGFVDFYNLIFNHHNDVLTR